MSIIKCRHCNLRLFGDIPESLTCRNCEILLAQRVDCHECNITVTTENFGLRALKLCLNCYNKKTNWRNYFTHVKDPIVRFHLNKAASDFQYFVEHFFKLKLVEYQLEMLRAISNPKYDRMVIEVPREHGKSTYVELYAAWILIFRPFSYILIFSSTEKQAKDRSRNIQLLIRGTVFEALANQRKWGAIEFYLHNDSKCMVGGVGQQVAGARHGLTRPNLIICDDIVPYDNANTSDALVEGWFFDVMSNLGNPDTKIIVVGTPYRLTDIIATLKTKERYTEEQHGGIYLRFEALLGEESTLLRQDDISEVKTLWPTKWHAKALKDKLIEIGDLFFARNYLCRCVDDKSRLYPSHLIDQAKDLDRSVVPTRPSQAVWVVAGVDLARSAEAGADYFVITIIGITEDYRYQILWIERQKGLPYIQQKQKIRQMHERYHLDLCVIESNQYQGVLGQELAALTSIPIMDYHTGSEKRDFERGLPKIRSHMENLRLRLPAQRPVDPNVEVLISEMGGYVIGDDYKILEIMKHNDTVMSLWLAIIGCDKHVLNVPELF